MKKFIVNIFWGNENKIWSFVLFFTLFPFIILSFFNMPMGDDFNFGAIGRDNSPIHAVSYWYNSWGGRYSQELFLTILNPLSYNSRSFFWLPPLVFISGICFSIFLLIKVIHGKTQSSTDYLILLSSVLFLVFNLMPEIGETLYWVTGAYTYQTGNIFFILLIATVVKLNQTNHFSKTLFLTLRASILIILIAGTNEISMLYMLGFSAIFLLQQYFSSKKLVIPLFLFLVGCISSYIAIVSPGNLLRATHTGGILQNIPKAILESFIRGSFYLVFWLPSTFLLSLIIWKQIGIIAGNYSDTLCIKKKNEIFLVLIGFFLIVCAGFFPSLASTGWNPPRSVAPVFIVFILLYFGIIIYYYHFFNSLLLKIRWNRSSINNITLFFLLIGFCNMHNIMNAYVDIVSLKAFKYNKEVTKLYKELSTDRNSTIYTTPLNARPSTLPIRWPDHYNRLVNDEIEMYFHKKVEMKPHF